MKVSYDEDLANHIDPESCVGYRNRIMRAVGRSHLALKGLERRLEMDPLSPWAHAFYANHLTKLGRFDEARSSFKRAQELGYHEPAHVAELAFTEGDAQALRKLLNLGRSSWRNLSRRYPLYEAALAHLERKPERVKEILSRLKSSSPSDMYLRSCMALLESDYSLALDYYSHHLAEAPRALCEVHMLGDWYVRLFPDYHSHPRYLEILRHVGLDQESIAKLKIPPLPF